MTPADRIAKAAHMAIERKAAMLNAQDLRDVHEIVVRIKPRGADMRASVTLAAVEERV